MAEYTTNLNLEKPSENDNFRRNVLNGNMDKIDAGIGTVQAQIDSHKNTTATPHGATSLAAAGKIIARDANGRAKVAAPSEADDIARKDTVDAHLADSVKIELSEIQPNTPDKNTYWYKIGSFNPDVGGGDGVSVANAVTGDDPPGQSQYWFDPL